ncbi:hypothetical protein BS78_04G213100 [Paspalum vaginatum]|nr:hypothetical protein BS78_04G213100 [Paspalum vaginatum]
MGGGNDSPAPAKAIAQPNHNIPTSFPNNSTEKGQPPVPFPFATVNSEGDGKGDSFRGCIRQSPSSPVAAPAPARWGAGDLTAAARASLAGGGDGANNLHPVLLRRGR